MKENKNNTWIFIGVGILLLLVLTQTNLFKNQEEFATIGVHYYNDGVEVFPQKLFSIFSVVTPPGGSYNQIAFSIVGMGGNLSYSNIQIVNASPTAFKNSLSTTTQSLSIKQSKILWNSSLMDTSQFESLTQPVRFWIKISGKNDYTGATEYTEGYVDLDIGAECVSHSTYNCYSDDVYWYNSCGNREDKKEECGTSGYVVDYSCSNGDVYRDYITRGCSAGTCSETTTVELVRKDYACCPYSSCVPGSGESNCNTYWTCGSWGECIDGQKFRACHDIYSLQRYGICKIRYEFYPC